MIFSHDDVQSQSQISLFLLGLQSFCGFHVALSSMTVLVALEKSGKNHTSSVPLETLGRSKLRT